MGQLNGGECRSSESYGRLPMSAAVTVIVMAMFVSGLYCVPASGLLIHRYESQIKEVPAGPSLAGPMKEMNSMTVDSGHVWLAENAGTNEKGEAASRIDEFNASTLAFELQLSQAYLPTYGLLSHGVAVGDVVQQEYAGGLDQPVIGVFGSALGGSFLGVWNGKDTPAGHFASVNDVAVDDSQSLGDHGAGRAYVVDGLDHVVDVFSPEAGTKEKYLTQLSSFTNPIRVVVNNVNGDVFVVDEVAVGPSKDVVRVYRPEVLGGYELVRTVTGISAGIAFGEIKALAVDSGNGEFYVVEEGRFVKGELLEPKIYQFSSIDAVPSAKFLGTVNGKETPEKDFLQVNSIAVDPVSHWLFVGDYRNGLFKQVNAVDVFGPTVVAPDVRVEPPPTNVEVDPESHTWSVALRGSVDPVEAGDATCAFAWGVSKALGNITACNGRGESFENPVPNGKGFVSVNATVPGLEPGTEYFYRLQATNANGTNPGTEEEDAHFTTPGPALRDESVTKVGSSSVSFHASVNPHNAGTSLRTSYRFEFDTTPYARGGLSHGSRVPVPDGTLGPGGERVPLEEHVQGLVAGTTYHYRVVVFSELSLGVVEEFDGPDEVFRTEPEGDHGVVLPDGRAWELVSPSEKRGALIRPIGEAGLVQASSGGDRFTYVVTGATESDPHGNAVRSQVLAGRGGSGGWRDRDIAMSHGAPVGLPVGEGYEYRYFSEDLGFGLVQSMGVFTRPGGSGGFEDFPVSTARTVYERHDLTCESEPGTCYEPLVTATPAFGDVPVGTEFGGSRQFFGGVKFVGATADGTHVIVSSEAPLPPVSIGVPAPPVPVADALYEWSAGMPASERLRLVSILPMSEGGDAVGGATLGTGSVARNAVSADGSRVFFAAGQHLYVRDLSSEVTVRLDVGEGSETTRFVPGFQAASTDGSVVWFTDEGTLTSNSGGKERQADLYRCNISDVVVGGELVPHCALSDVTPVPGPGEPGEGESAGVQGAMVGASEDGSYVYFVANGVLASGATPGTCDEHKTPPPGATCNLYVSHDGETRLVAVLSSDDFPDWATALNRMPASVSGNGLWLAFMSDRSLTGYDNRDAVSERPDEEVFLYSAATGGLVCASCDPSNARPTGFEYGSVKGSIVGGFDVWNSPSQWLAANVPGWTPYEVDHAVYQSRFLSGDGRLFFNSDGSLVPLDTNGNQDVYEFEPVGVGGCSEGTASGSVVFVREVAGSPVGGCVGLVSSGVAFGESGFLDASAGGGDVFFLTGEKLVGGDTDTAIDVYDAHECVPGSPCPSPVASPPPACVSASACRGAPMGQPLVYGPPSSATFTGVGNVAGPSSPRLSRAQRLANALKKCAGKRSRRKRLACDRSVHRRFGVVRSARLGGLRVVPTGVAHLASIFRAP